MNTNRKYKLALASLAVITVALFAGKLDAVQFTYCLGITVGTYMTANVKQKQDATKAGTPAA